MIHSTNNYPLPKSSPDRQISCPSCDKIVKKKKKLAKPNLQLWRRLKKKISIMKRMKKVTDPISWCTKQSAYTKNVVKEKGCDLPASDKND